jgi:HKD family nuclease
MNHPAARLKRLGAPPSEVILLDFASQQSHRLIWFAAVGTRYSKAGNEGKTMPKLQTLLGDGCAVVVGLPENFNLSGALRSAKQIRLATAFAHISGWESLKADVEASAGDIFLLTGLGFNQTEPAVLRDWLDLHLRRGKAVTAKLASSKPFFHPKVLIVHSPQKQFAIVSSGNLSNGGLQTNCECGVFVGDAPTVTTLCDWFDEQFKSSEEFNGGMIDAYEPHYKRAKKQLAALAQQQKKTEKELKTVGEASFAKWSRALELAEAFYRDKDFKAKYAKRVRLSNQMLGHSNPPKFDFDRNGWEEFYAEGVLGKLNPIYRDRVFKAGPRLRNALRLLIQDPQATIPAVLGKNGKLRIIGFAENTLSKILAANSPSEWFVYNSRVATVLADFGYKSPRDAGRDGRYIAFRNVMQKFMAACEEHGLSNVDAISLDAFFLHLSKVLKRKKVNP